MGGNERKEYNSIGRNNPSKISKVRIMYYNNIVMQMDRNRKGSFTC